MDCYNLNVHTYYMAFKVHRRLQDDWELVELQDDRLGSVLTILPAAGAILNSWKIANADEKMEIIDGYADRHDFVTNVHNGFKSAKLSPFVCRLKSGSYHWEGKTYSIRKFMLNGDDLHGLLYDAAFVVSDSGVSEASCFVEMSYHFAGDNNGYPFQYHCVVRYTLAAGNLLIVTTNVKNSGNGGGAIPIADGWHPYFSLGGIADEWRLQISSDQMLEYDGSLIPTGKLINNSDFREGRLIGDIKLDNGFLLEKDATPFCILKNPSNNISVEFSSARNYPYLQLYIPDHRKSIAIENLSSAPDAFNNGMGLTLLKPNEEVMFEVEIKVRSNEH